MRILALFTRNPFTRATGRKAVLKTIVRSLSGLGHSLDLVIYDEDRTNAPEEIDIYWRQPIGTIRLATNLIFRSMLGAFSFNESAYFSPSEASFLRKLNEKNRYDIVVADMIRLAPLASATGLKMVVDLDDLLSVRYSTYLRAAGSEQGLLGYYSTRLPGWISRVTERLSRHILTWEIERLKQRETYWVENSDAVSLVSPQEAENLSSRTGKRIFSLPMSVDPHAECWSPGSPFQSDAVFVGGMDYSPNVTAIDWYLKEVSEHTSATLTVVGNSPPEVQARFECDRIRFLGYVDDLFDTLMKSRVFVAPIVSGSGIKTKVLEAMAAGIPIVATSAALSGIGMRNGEHCLVADDGRDFAAAIDRVLRDPQAAYQRASRAREYLAANFSSRVLEHKWEQVLRSVSEKRD